MIVFVRGWRIQYGKKTLKSISSRTYDGIDQVDDAHKKEAMMLIDACDCNDNGVKVLQHVGHYAVGTYYIQEDFLKKLAARDKVKL